MTQEYMIHLSIFYLNLRGIVDADSDLSFGPAGNRRVVTGNRTRDIQLDITISGVAANLFQELVVEDSETNLRVETILSVLPGDVKSATNSNRLIENSAHFGELEEGNSFNSGSRFYAKYPGLYGNNVGISIVDAGTTDFNANAKYFNEGASTDYLFSDVFDTAPTHSVFASNHDVEDDEVHVVIFDVSGEITGNVGTILETFGYLSKAANATTIDGAPNYYREVVNSQSRYVWIARDFNNDGTDIRYPEVSDDTHGFGDRLTSATTGGSFDVLEDNAGSGSVLRVVLANATAGVSDTNTVDVTNGGNDDRTGGWELFADPEAQADVSIFLAGLAGGAVAEDATSLAAKKNVIDEAERRKDIVAVVSPSFEASVTAPTATKIIDYFNDYNSSSYGVFTSGWKYQYDRYNDLFFWMPLDADVAGLMARTDATNAPWFSPAGLNRGQIRDVVRLSFNPNQADRDDLYQGRVNPIVTFPGEGTVLYGDKTALSRPSAFDRINVRRLFIVLEKAIATAARFQLFELNDEFTRAAFVAAVEPFLRDVQAQRGIDEFRVIADTTVNTPEVISGNEFRANIFIRPTYSINFITLNFVAVRGGVQFDEIAGIVA